MMKWGRKKPSSPSPSRNSSISHVFPMFWLSKFKQKGSNSEHKPTKAKPNLACQSTPMPASWRDGRFYGRDDDSSYWRLSFGQDRVEGEKSRGGLQSVRYSSDDELEFPLSSCQNCRPVATEVAGREEMRKFNDMVVVSDIRKPRELNQNVEVSPEIEVEKKRESKEFELPRRKAVKDRKSRKTSRRPLEEKRAELERQSDKVEEMPTVPEEKDIFELEPATISQKTERDCQKATASGSRKYSSASSANLGNLNLEAIEEDCAFEEKLNSELQKLKDMNIKGLMTSKKQRKSVYISRELQRRTKQSGKVRVYSPRTVARVECKIKALEDMKKAKMKMKKRTKEKAVEDRTAFDSFAVVKSSFDPQQDFRNSMIEMISEKGIWRPEELEELLVCYLTLNANEYHDLIIKIFRQVWIDLNQKFFGSELQNEHHYSMINHFLS